MLKLYDHQLQCIDLAVKTNSACGLFMEPGLGKTITTYAIYQYLKQKTLDLKLIVVCPKSLIFAAWHEDHDKFFRQYKIIDFKSYCKKSQDFDIMVINYEALQTKAWQQYAIEVMQGNVMLSLDECFIKGTLVETKTGLRRIEDIQVGDYIKNCTGYDKVIGTRLKTLETKVIIEYNNSIIECSENHPFFTDKGWIFAKDLKKGDKLMEVNYAQEGLRMVRERIFNSSENSTNKKKTILFSRQKEKILFKELLSEMENDTTRNKSETIQFGSTRKNCSKNNDTNGQYSKTYTQQNRQNKQQNAFAGSASKSFCNIKENEMEAKCSGWKWTWNDNTTSNFISRTWEVMATRIHSVFRQKKEKLSNALQNRHCKSRFNARTRDRWGKPLLKKTARQKKRQDVGYFRVDNITIQKQGSDGKFADGTTENKFYDLEIENHPSFTVAGALVHNSSRLKSHNTKTTKILLRMAKFAQYRVILSGTPHPNGLHELWAQICFIQPDLFPRSFHAWKNTFFHLERGGEQIIMRGQILTRDTAKELFGKGWKWAITDQNREKLMKTIAPYVIYKHKTECLDLPEQIDTVREVSFNPEEKRLYKEMVQNLLVEIQGCVITAQLILTKIMKLRQLTGGFIIDETGEAHNTSTAKVRELLAVMHELGGAQVMIWAHFKHEIKLIERALLDDGYDVVTYYSETKDRERSYNLFKDNKVQVFLAHPQSCAHGLTLVNCNNQIWYSMSYSYEQYTQGKDRCHRIGQKNAVTYTHLIVEDSVDETIYKALQRKENINDIAMSIVGGLK